MRRGVDFVQGAQGRLAGRGLSRPEVIPGTMFQEEGTACAKALRWAVLVSEEPQGPRPVCAMGAGWAGVLSATVKTWAVTWRLKASCQSKCF